MLDVAHGGLNPYRTVSGENILEFRVTFSFTYSAVAQGLAEELLPDFAGIPAE